MSCICSSRYAPSACASVISARRALVCSIASARSRLRLTKFRIAYTASIVNKTLTVKIRAPQDTLDKISSASLLASGRLAAELVRLLQR